MINQTLKTITNILSTQYSGPPRGSAKFIFTKKIITEQIKAIYFRDVEYWFNFSLKLFKDGKFSTVMYREEALALGALLLQISFGDFNEQKHKVGFLIEKEKVRFIHPAFRKDTTFESEMYKQYSTIVGLDDITAKKQFIELIRILRRLEENIFNIYIYSADKIEAKEAVLIIGETIIIFDDPNQPYIYEIPISDLKSSHEAHTSSNERERLRKQIGHVSHLHQIVLDIGRDSMLRILSNDRDAIRRRFEGVVESVTRAKQEKDAEDLEKRSSKMNLSGSGSSTAGLSSSKSPRKFTLSSTTIQIPCWLLDYGAANVDEIIFTLDGTALLIVYPQSTEIIHEIPIDNITSWRQERTSYDLRTKLVTQLKAQAYDVHQLYIELEGSKEPIRILSLDQNRWKIRNLLKILSDELTTISKEEYWCQIVPQDGLLKSVIMKFVPEQVEFRDALTNQTLIELNEKSIVSWDIKPIAESMKNKFEQGIEDSIVIDIGSSQIILGSDEVSHIINELKKIHYNSESYEKSFSQRGKSEVPARCWLLDNKNCMRGFMLTADNKIMIAGSDDQVIKEIACGSVQGWLFHIQTNTNEPITIVSQEPHRTDLKQIEYLINSITGRGSMCAPSLISKHDNLIPEKENEGSGSEIEIGGLSDSNSGEH